MSAGAGPDAAPRWTAVAAALLAGVVAACAFGKVSPVLPVLKEEFALTLVQAGWLAASFNSLAAASAVFFGILADRVGAVRFCIAGVACIASGNVLGAAAGGAGLLFASRLIEGVGFIVIIVSAPALVAAAAPQRRGLALGLWSTYMPAGISLVLLASGVLVEPRDWRAAWTGLAACAAACGLLIAAQSRRYALPRGGTRRSLASVRRSLAQPVPWLLGLAFSMHGVQHMTFAILLPTYLLETRGMAAGPAAALTALAMFVNVFGNLLGGWLVQRNVARGHIIAATFAMTSIMFAGMFSPSLPEVLRYGCACLFSMLTGMIPASALSAGMRYARSPAEFGAIQGLIVQVNNVGIFLGPPVVAAVVTWGGSWDSALAVMLGCGAAGLAFSFAIGRLERRGARHDPGRA